MCLPVLLLPSSQMKMREHHSLSLQNSQPGAILLPVSIDLQVHIPESSHLHCMRFSTVSCSKVHIFTKVCYLAKWKFDKFISLFVLSVTH
jgi:hypothetical protein